MLLTGSTLGAHKRQRCLAFVILVVFGLFSHAGWVWMPAASCMAGVSLLEPPGEDQEMYILKRIVSGMYSQQPLAHSFVLLRGFGARALPVCSTVSLVLHEG